MSYCSDYSEYSDSYDNDSCYSDDVHSVDSYDSTPSSHHSYDGAPSENCCPCQPVQIKIVNPENVYVNRDCNFADDDSTACDHNRSEENGQADDKISHCPDDNSRENNPCDDDSRKVQENVDEEKNENIENGSDDKIPASCNMIATFRGLPIDTRTPSMRVRLHPAHPSKGT